MSPSVFLPAIEEGNSVYKGQFRSMSVTAALSPAGPTGPPAPAPGLHQEAQCPGRRGCGLAPQGSGLCPSLFKNPLGAFQAQHG